MGTPHTRKDNNNILIKDEHLAVEKIWLQRPSVLTEVLLFWSFWAPLSFPQLAAPGGKYEAYEILTLVDKNEKINQYSVTMLLFKSRYLTN